VYVIGTLWILKGWKWYWHILAGPSSEDNNNNNNNNYYYYYYTFALPNMQNLRH
jgi:hypothetical protein